MPAMTNPRFITRLKEKGFDENEPIDLQALLEEAGSLEIWDNEKKCVVDPKDPEIQRLMFLQNRAKVT